MGLVWRLGAFQKSPDTKGTRVEECKTNAKARGARDERGKSKEKKHAKKARKQHANNMRRK